MPTICKTTKVETMTFIKNTLNWLKNENNSDSKVSNYRIDSDKFLPFEFGREREGENAPVFGTWLSEPQGSPTSMKKRGIKQPFPKPG